MLKAGGFPGHTGLHWAGEVGPGDLDAGKTAIGLLPFGNKIDTHVCNLGWCAAAHQQRHHGLLGPDVWCQGPVGQVL